MNNTNENTDPVFKAMREGFELICSMVAEDNIMWRGPISDLVELSHMMWTKGYARDLYGRRETYTALLHRLCDSLHVKCPTHHTAVINNIKRRKFAESSLYARFAGMMTADSNALPIERFLSEERRTKSEEI